MPFNLYLLNEYSLFLLPPQGKMLRCVLRWKLPPCKFFRKFFGFWYPFFTIQIYFLRVYYTNCIQIAHYVHYY